ncbi:exo-beta-N-acetylmuramidase NamZ family protein [Haliangium sp.]|uniref:exo-beta-N-acetylmuramidase NamZ family protein n=1 Tax=Haliangium sp. TaxID=2663208 RepID=UPI003D0FCD8D
MTRVATGLERVLDERADLLAGKRIGLIANPTAVDARLRHAVDLLAAHPRIDLRILFGPEHGLRGDAQDMIPVDAGRDRRTGLPVVSLYGTDEASLAPRPEHLDGLDAVVFDVQDVGARYYTYVWTMVLAMRACARAGVGFVVLDRPNPIGGVAVEGGAIEPGYHSFVGLRSLPNRHGLTAGELARWAAAEEGLDLALEVVTMAGWRREMFFEDTGLPWVMPSPNMPTRDTALVYPGMCLVEGTNLNEGRGTTRPFELAGAPFIDGDALAAELADLPGLIARPVVFTPTFHKWHGQACGGVQLHPTSRTEFRSYLTGVAFLRAIHALWPEHFGWRRDAYEFVTEVPAIDVLAGSAALREGIEAGASLPDLAATWADAEAEFRRRHPELHLYPAARA